MSSSLFECKEWARATAEGFFTAIAVGQGRSAIDIGRLGEEILAVSFDAYACDRLSADVFTSAFEARLLELVLTSPAGGHA